jgi:hypothetical protein
MERNRYVFQNKRGFIRLHGIAWCLCSLTKYLVTIYEKSMKPTSTSAEKSNFSTGGAGTTDTNTRVSSTNAMSGNPSIPTPPVSKSSSSMTTSAAPKDAGNSKQPEKKKKGIFGGLFNKKNRKGNGVVRGKGDEGSI